MNTSDLAVITAMKEAAERAANLSVGGCLFMITVEPDGMHVRGRATRPAPGGGDPRVFEKQWVAGWPEFRDNPRLINYALDSVRDQLKSAAF